MGEMVTFASNGGTAEGYLAKPASGKGPRRDCHPGVVGPHPVDQGCRRPPRRRGLPGARARPLPWRDCG